MHVCVYYQLNIRHRVAECLWELLQIQPSLVEGYVNLGAALKDLDELPQAVKALEQAVAVDRFSNDAHYNKAQIHDQLGQFELSMNHFEAGLASWFVACAQ